MGKTVVKPAKAVDGPRREEQRFRRVGRCSLLALIIPVVLAMFCASAAQVVRGEGAIDLGDYRLYVTFALCAVIFAVAFELVWRLLVQRPAAAGRASDASAAGRTWAIRRLLDFESRKGVIVCSLIILACWALYIICLYPGVAWYDTTWQIYEFYSGELTDHHPFMLAFLYGGFISIGRALFGYPAAGLYLLIILQCIGASVGFALLCQEMRRLGAAWGACLGALALFALFPYMPMMFASLMKDTLHATLFLYFAVLFLRACGDEEYARRRGVLIGIAVLSVAICLTKKTGVFMVAIPLLVLGVVRFARRERVRADVWPGVIGLGCLLLIYVILPALVFPALGVKHGGKQEVIAVPIQQVARQYVLFTEGAPGYEGAFSAEDVQMLDDFLLVDVNAIPIVYDYTIVDPIKRGGSLKDGTLMGDFLALWARLGWQHPLGHYEAWIGLEAGWFSLTEPLSVKSVTGFVAWPQIISPHITWPDAGFGNEFVAKLYDTVAGIPILRVLYRMALWASILPAWCLYVIARTPMDRRAKGKLLLAVLPYCVIVLTLMVCPTSANVNGSRYILPLVCTAPLYLCAAVAAARKGLSLFVNGLAAQRAGDEHG